MPAARGASWRGPLLVFLVALAAFAAGASRRELWRTDEHRYAEVARQIGHESGSWLVPHLNGAVYAHKPPGFFWLIALLHDGLGLGLETAAKGVSALAASLGVALVFALGRRLYGEREALAAALVLASSEMYLSLGLRANLDALLSACITASLYAWWRGEEAGASAAALRWRLLAGLFSGLGILVKGPVALAVPAVVVLAHGAGTRGWRGMAPAGGLAALGMALLPGLAWLGAAAAEGGAGYARDLVLGHGVAHPLGGVGKLRPFWHYVKTLPAVFAPWSVALPAAVALLWTGRPRRSQDVFVLAWLFAPLLLLSLSPAKRHLYLLPVLPGAALVVGPWLAWLRSGRPAEDGRALQVLSQIAQRLLGIAGLVLGVAVGAAALLVSAGRSDLLSGLWSPLGLIGALGSSALLAALLISCLAIPAGVALLRRWRGATAWRADLALGISTALFLLAVFHPFENLGRRVSPFYRQARQLVGSDPLAWYGGGDWAPNRWLERTQVPRILTPEDTRAYAEQRPAPGRPVWLVAEADAVKRRGMPPGFGEVLRYEPPLGKALVLLRSEAPRS